MKTCDLKLHTPLAKDEVIGRLRDHMDHEPPGERSLKTSFNGTHEVIGWIQDDELQLRRRIPYSSLFQPLLSASLHSSGAGTVIEGVVAMRKGAHIFYQCWFIAVTALVTVIFAATLLKFIQGTAVPGTWTGFLVPFLLMIIWAGYRRYSRRVVTRDAEFITSHLKRTLGIADPS